MPDRVVQVAARLGMFGAGVFGTTTAVLSVLQYDFMRGLGWDPLAAPTFDWPSGLALGPYGGWMTAAFVIGGIGLGGLALALRRTLGPAIGPRVLFGSAAGMLLLAIPADPTLRDYPATLAGQLHDAAFALLGLTFLPALLGLAARFRREARWADMAVPTLITAVLAGPAFLFKWFWFYGFLVAGLLWVAAVGWRLIRNAEGA